MKSTEELTEETREWAFDKLDKIARRYDCYRLMVEEIRPLTWIQRLVLRIFKL